MLGEPQQSAWPAQQSELTQVPEQLQLPQKTIPGPRPPKSVLKPALSHLLSQ